MDIVGHEIHAADIVAEQQDDVGLKRGGTLANALDPVRTHPWLAGMDIGDNSDPELEPVVQRGGVSR